MRRQIPTLLKKILFIVFILQICFGSVSLFAQSYSANAGKEFHISYLHLSVIGNTNTLQLKVVVEKSCTITAQYNNQPSVYWNGWNNTLVPPGIYTANVSKDDVVNIPPNGTGLISYRTLSLTSTENICVYAINYVTNSSDATCVLPTSAWGTEYRLATAVPGINYHCAYAVVASEPGTMITLHNNSTITLNKNEVYHFLNATSDDMTGVRVAATKPVALFSGNTRALGPGAPYTCSSIGASSSDHTFEQLWSVDKWGKDFFAFPVSTPNGSGNWGGMLALVASENSTDITVSGGINGGTPLNYALDAGGKQYVCHVMSGLTRVVSTEPIMVFLVLPDPTVMSILPTNQRIQNALVAPFIFTGLTSINQHGIDLLVPAAYWDKTEIKHNGIVVQNSLYTVNTSTYFPDWYHVRKNLNNEDIEINIMCPGGFLAYLSGNGGQESYGFSAGAGADNLQNYFTIQEKGTTIDTYYENTTEIRHTFAISDIIVVKRTLETPFNYVKWLINGTEYAIAENTNIINTLNFPASALHSGENTITMSVRFSGTTADSLYTGKVWLLTTNHEAEFFANEIPSGELSNHTICNRTGKVDFRAEIEGLSQEAGSLKWFIDEDEKAALQDQLTWSNDFSTGTYEIKMWVRYDNGETAEIISTLKVEIFFLKIQNVRH